MPAFALPSALATFLGTDVDTARAGVLLGMVSDAIRARCQQRIDYVPGDVVTLSPESSLVSAFLPELPVVDVSAVDQLGQDGVWYSLGTQQYEWTPTGRLYRLTSAAGWMSSGAARWTARPRSLRVTYSHGFQEVPGDLAGVAVAVAARLYENPMGMSTTAIGGFHEQSGVRAPGIDFTDVEQDILDRYSMPRLG